MKAMEKEADELAEYEWDKGQSDNQEWIRSRKEKEAKAKRDRAEALKAGAKWINRHIVDPLRSEKEDRDEAARAKKERAENIHREAAETGLPELLRKQFEAIAAGGGDVDAARAELQRKLTTRFGEAEAKRLVDDGADDGKRAAMMGSIFGKPDKVSHSATIGSLEFARAIQSGVSNDDPAAKQLAELVKIRNGIDKVATELHARDNKGQPVARAG